MEASNVAVLLANVAVWYHSSTISATASQALVAITIGSAVTTVHWTQQVFMMALATLLQMIAGSLLGVAIVSLVARVFSGQALRDTCSHILSRFTQGGASSSSISAAPSSSSKGALDPALILRNQLLFPGFHAAGSVFTNLGYAFSSASFVQLVKLTEPMQTIAIDIVLRKIYGKHRAEIKVSVVTFVLGMLFVFLGRHPAPSSHPSISGDSSSSGAGSSYALILVILSGCCLSTRNVLKKLIHNNDDAKDSSSALKDHNQTSARNAPVVSKVMEGFYDFIYLSVGGSILLLPVVCVSCAASAILTPGSAQPSLWHIAATTASSGTVILSHPTYNLASILVLSFVSAPIHSMLNSGKRIYSTLMVMMFFHESVTSEMMLGFLYVAIAIVPNFTESQRFVVVATTVGLLRTSEHMGDVNAGISKGNPMPQMSKASVLLPATALNRSSALGRGFNSVRTIGGSTTYKKPTVSCNVNFKRLDMRLCNYIPYNGNFGDELGPAMILKLLEREFNCSAKKIPVLNLAKIKPRPNEVCLFSLGSIFHMVRGIDHVWGTGINPTWSKTLIRQANTTFYSLRGPKSEAMVRAHLNITTPMGHGDPGFLVPFLYPEYAIPEKETNRIETNRSQRFCFIPHYHDRANSDLQLLKSKLTIISVSKSWRAVVKEITNCDYVASTSLHGFILADAFGIPSRWFQFAGSRTSVTEGSFKYQDYYESVNRMNQMPLQDLQKVLEPSAYDSPLMLADRRAFADRTIASFPFHLFDSNPVQRPKVLIIMMGTLRGGELAWETFYRNVLLPNEADLALMVPEDTSPHSSSLMVHAKYVWTHLDHRDWGVAIDQEFGGNGTWRELATAYNFTGLLGGTKESTRGSGAIVFMLRHYISQILVQDGLLDQYDRFVLTRSDHYYGCLHDLRDLDPEYIWLPEGENYGGVTDRHVVVSRAHVLKVLNILPPVIADPHKYMGQKFVNPEKLIRRRWAEENVLQFVRRFDRMMFTCAKEGDESRWRKVSLPVAEGVRVKYPKEYNLTKVTCARKYSEIDY